MSNKKKWTKKNLFFDKSQKYLVQKKKKKNINSGVYRGVQTCAIFGRGSNRKIVTRFPN